MKGFVGEGQKLILTKNFLWTFSQVTSQEKEAFFQNFLVLSPYYEDQQISEV